MKTTTLGSLTTSAIGYGAMVLVDGMYGPADDNRSLATLNHAIDQGATLIDTADAYGADGHNERLVGRAIQGRRDEVQVATKWGIASHGRPVRHHHAQEIWIDARPERARAAAHASLQRLGIDAIDLWYVHFPDPGVPVEESVGAMAELVAEGKVRHLGLSNVTSEQLLAAHQTHPVTAVQAEYSLWTRDPERELLPTLKELNVGFVAANRDRYAPLRELGGQHQITPAQLALAWLVHQGVVPIPGTRTPAHLDENLNAADITLDDETLKKIDEIARPGAAAGQALL